MRCSRMYIIVYYRMMYMSERYISDKRGNRVRKNVLKENNVSGDEVFYFASQIKYHLLTSCLFARNIFYF